MKEIIKNYFKLKNELNCVEDLISKRCIEVSEYLIENDLYLKENKVCGNFDDFYIEDQMVKIKLYETWVYGGYDYHTISIDLNIFESDNWLELLIQYVKDKNEKKIQKDILKKEEDRIKKIKEAEELIKKLKSNI